MLVCPECHKLYPSDATGCADDGRALVPLEDLPGDARIEPGDLVGEYRIDRKLGAGTFGAVYAAEQPLIGKRVAIKVLHKKFASDAAVVSRFISEARAVNRIRHKNIIDIFSFGVMDDKTPYFVMELLEGTTLKELIDREKHIEPARALPILRGIAAGLDAAHAAGITHRDLKPDNVFLAADPDRGHFPKLLDFGIAKLISDDATHKTASGVAIGTPSYMSPEQCRGQPVDHRADIYALGVVIHEMLTGHRLFEGDSSMDVLFMHISDPPRRMSDVRPALPKELDAPVLAMLAKKPRDRPDSAGAAVAALAERIQGSSDGRAGTSAPAQPDTRREGAAAQDAPPAERPRPAHEVATVAVRGRKNEPPTAVGGAAVGGAGVAVASTPSEERTGIQGPIEATELVVGPKDDRSSQSEAARTTEEPPATPPASIDATPETPPEAPAEPMIPAATADGRFALSSKGNTIKVWDMRTGKAVHTFAGQPGSVSDPAPRAPRTKGARTAPAAPAPRWRSWAAIAAAGAIGAAAAALAGRSHTPPAPIATAEPAATPGPPDHLPRTVTLRFAVTPPDADVLLDGLRAGKASEPLELPRSDRRTAIRIEKPGYETETLWIVPDRDAELPPIVLRAAEGPGHPR